MASTFVSHSTSGEVLDLTVAADKYPARARDYCTVYVPLSAWPKAAALKFNAWEPASGIPRGIGLDYIVPQIAIENALDTTSFCAWNANKASFASEGTVWTGTRVLMLRSS